MAPPFSYPQWMQWYKKPSYTDIRQFASSLESRAELSPSRRGSTESRRSADIPSKLSLEKILKNQPCSPMSLYDFYMYLKHIEHSPENLEFYVWFKNYEAGRLTSLSAALPRQIAASHEPVIEYGSEADLTKGVLDDKSVDGTTVTSVTEVHDEFDLDQHVNTDEIYSQIAALVNPMCGCIDPSKSSIPSTFSALTSKFRSHTNDATPRSNSPSISSAELGDARRAELDAITVLFLLPGSPKELNIPAPMRNKVLSALQNSTSAEHLAPVADHCYVLLKNCSHRNFIRLGVSNGTFETVCMATSLGIVLTIVGFLIMFILAFASPSLHHSNRWRALAPWPLWSIGVGLILSGLRGSCFFLLLFSRRQPLPWEEFEDDQSVVEKRTGLMRFLSKLMIFDRKLKVKDDSLRGLQRKIVMQSVGGGIIFATVMCGVFLGLPIWK